METIREISRVRSRVCIELDNGMKYWLFPSDVLEGGFEAGMEVDPEKLKDFVLTRQYPSALNKAVAMLARRICGSGEIREKLKVSRFSDETVEMVLYKLSREGLLNDADFAAQWTGYRSSMKYGPRRISQELRHKGVHEEDARVALESIDEEDALTQAFSLAEKAVSRARPGEDIRKAENRIMNSLVRRGFDWDTARQAVRAALQKED